MDTTYRSTIDHEDRLNVLRQKWLKVVNNLIEVQYRSDGICNVVASQKLSEHLARWHRIHFVGNHDHHTTCLATARSLLDLIIRIRNILITQTHHFLNQLKREQQREVTKSMIFTRCPETVWIRMTKGRLFMQAQNDVFRYELDCTYNAPLLLASINLLEWSRDDSTLLLPKVCWKVFAQAKIAQ